MSAGAQTLVTTGRAYWAGGEVLIVAPAGMVTSASVTSGEKDLSWIDPCGIDSVVTMPFVFTQNLICPPDAG